MLYRATWMESVMLIENIPGWVFLILAFVPVEILLGEKNLPRTVLEMLSIPRIIANTYFCGMLTLWVACYWGIVAVYPAVAALLMVPVGFLLRNFFRVVAR